MAEVILMPRLSDTMTEGVIAAWHKKVGEQVKKGDLLAEIETDKATMELESYKDGILLHVGADKGGKLQVNDLLAIIGNAGEDISEHLKEGGQSEGLRTPSEKSEVGGQKAEGEVRSEGLRTPPEKSEGGSDGISNKEQGTPNDEGRTKTAAAQPETKNEKPRPTGSSGQAETSPDLSKMDEVVLMPRLSDTMTEGVIAAWHKKVGDDVKKGDVLADIETDKATMELESYKNGKLLYQGAQAGEKIEVNELLCIIGEEGKVDVDAIVNSVKGEGAKEQKNIQQARPDDPVGRGTSNDEVETQKVAAQQNVAAQQPETRNQKPETSPDGRVKASPLAKKLAKEKGIDLSQVKGTGDNGRITKSDIDNFVPQEKPAETPKQQPAVQPILSGEEGYSDLTVSQMRKVIAKRLGESKFSAPHFYLTMEINMDNAMQARAQMNEVSDVKISFNDMVIKAAAMALRRHPAVNSSWMGDFIRQYQHIHIGVAVAIEDGLIVPVVRFADQKTLSQIAAETKELSGKARNKKLQPNEFTGNTFTISNLGMMDIDEFTGIINPPDSAIMAVGRIKEVVVRKGEGFGVSNVMKITMSCDHRSVDGAVGATFLQTFKRFMENPVTMLV